MAASYPQGRSAYKPSGARALGAPSPQSHPEKFSSEDLMAEAKHLLRTNKKYGSHPLRTMKIMDLTREVDRRKKAAAVMTDSHLTTERRK